MEQPPNKPLPILEEVENYLRTKFKLWEYRTFEKLTSIMSELIGDLMFILLVIFIIIFISLTAALLIAHFLQSYWLGFGCITFLYILILIFFKFSKESLQNKLIKYFIKKIIK